MSQDKQKILKLIISHYPDVKCSLIYNSPFQLLIATILSAQCTDDRVNLVTKDLFKKYPSVNELAQADEIILQNDIRSTGFYKNKAKHILATSKKIIQVYKGAVPDNITDLLSLPGVARKTANVVLGNAYNIIEGIVVDTHVSRISQRLEWTENKDPVKIEKDLTKWIPKQEWINISHRLIVHGRSLCQAKKPKCEECFILNYCPYMKKQI